MTWAYHDRNIFNLNSFSVISPVGDYDISLSKALSPDDDDDYFVMSFESEEHRDEAFQEIKRMVFSRNL